MCTLWGFRKHSFVGMWGGGGGGGVHGGPLWPTAYRRCLLQTLRMIRRTSFTMLLCLISICPKSAVAALKLDQKIFFTPEQHIFARTGLVHKPLRATISVWFIHVKLLQRWSNYWWIVCFVLSQVKSRSIKLSADLFTLTLHLPFYDTCNFVYALVSQYLRSCTTARNTAWSNTIFNAQGSTDCDRLWRGGKWQWKTQPGKRNQNVKLPFPGKTIFLSVALKNPPDGMTTKKTGILAPEYQQALWRASWFFVSKFDWNLQKSGKKSLAKLNRPISQSRRCTFPMSQNAPFRTQMYAFVFWIVHCGIWNRYIWGFVIWSISLDNEAMQEDEPTLIKTTG